MRTSFIIAHRLVMLLAIAVIIGSVGLMVIFVVYADRVEEYTSGRRATQFHRELDVDRLDSYGGVFVVAHNSGARLDTTWTALIHGADVIEIDVVSIGGTLYSGHTTPPWWGSSTFRGPTLSQVWAVAGMADVIKLDLKESSPHFLDLLIAFLEERGHEHQVIISTRDVSALETFADRYPAAFRLLSVSTPSRLFDLKEDEDLIALIDGVTIRESLIDDDSALWLAERQLIVLAWTVNDLGRVNELVQYGVDAITTDNLAIMEVLGGRLRSGDLLPFRVAPVEA